LDTRETVEGRPNVEAEDRAAVGKGRGGVVIYDVSNLFARLWTVDDPVVSVERWLGIEARW